MAEKIVKDDEVTVKLGHVIPVKNLDRPEFSNAARRYNAVWVAGPRGDNEQCLLLTDDELRRAVDRGRKNPEDVPKMDETFKWLRDLFG